MIPVVAAIIAAVVAGGVAFTREQWLRRLDFQVAARVLYATFGIAVEGTRRSSELDDFGPVSQLPGKEQFAAAWEAYRADLAAGLIWEEWIPVMRAAERYLAVMAITSNDLPSQSKDYLNLEDLLEDGRAVLLPHCTRKLSWRNPFR